MLNTLSRRHTPAASAREPRFLRDGVASFAPRRPICRELNFRDYQETVSIGTERGESRGEEHEYRAWRTLRRVPGGTALSKGRYGNASEVVRAGLRLLEEREAKLTALRAAIEEGLESGPAEPFDVEAFIADKTLDRKRA